METTKPYLPISSESSKRKINNYFAPDVKHQEQMSDRAQPKLTVNFNKVYIF